jgi:predicted transcriptional regulator YdeE
MEHIIKPAFAVIGMEGSTEDGPGFIQALWEKANSRFGEVAHLAKTNPDGSLCGVWGAMSDFSRSFRPWEDNFTRGLYLAGVEVVDNAQPPEGWVRWDIPGYEYIRVENNTPDIFPRTLQSLAEQGLSLAGAVHDFTDPSTGKAYMLFPIRAL